MAQRRMFSRKITESDAFTSMPLSSQCLYFHIAMAADDDGFVEGVNRIRRGIGASEDDLKLLFAKSFLIPFESGVVVVRQWHVHNYIQKDRYTPTTHTEELKQLSLRNDGEKGAYVLICQCPEIPVSADVNPTVHGMDTKCIQSVSTGKVRDRVRDRDRLVQREPSYPEKKDERNNNTAGHSRARAGGYTGFSGDDDEDGEDAPIGHDGNWRYSPRARAATAQLVVDRMAEEHLPVSHFNTVFDLVYEAMEHRISPNEILNAARRLDISGFVLWKAHAEEQQDTRRRAALRQDEIIHAAHRQQESREMAYDRDDLPF